MSPLEAKVDDIESVPEQYRDLYEQSDSGYRLQVKGVEFPEDVEGLKSALQKERQAAKEAAQRLKQLEGVDLDEYKALRAEREKKEEENAAKRGEFEKLIQKKEAAWNEQVEQERKRAQSLEAQVLGLVRDQEARKALEQAGANVKLMLPHVLERVQVIDEDGARKAVVLNEEGAPRLNDDGKHLSISELVAEMAEQEEYLGAFPAKVGKGGGAAASSAGRANAGFDPKQASDAEKAAFIRENGFAAWSQLLGAK